MGDLSLRCYLQQDAKRGHLRLGAKNEDSDESRQGLLFGFLLANARTFADSRLEEWLFAATVVLVASVTLVFIMPVVHHHIRYLYQNFAKFQVRSHRWVLLGLPLLACGFYLTLCLPLLPLFSAGALGVAAAPLVAAGVGFVIRKAEL